jgi:hypothetical protein
LLIGAGPLDYIDYTLVRLAAESTRSALFDQAALEQLALAAYDTEAIQVGGPYTAVFDEIVVGLTIPRRGTAEAMWGPTSGTDRREGRLTVLGLLGDAGVRVDALWRGAVVARAAPVSSRIERVLGTWTDTARIDDEIIAARGGLPSDPGELEAERRARLLARLRAGFGQPEALSDQVFDAWLREAGARSVGDLMARSVNQLAAGALQVGFSAPSADPPAPRRLPIAVAVLVRDAPLRVAELLADSKLARDHLRELGLERAPEPGLVARQALVVAWMVPDATFDDPDWPGGDAGSPEERRNLRRAAAGQWLAREGIGLVTTPAHPST